MDKRLLIMLRQKSETQHQIPVISNLPSTHFHLYTHGLSYMNPHSRTLTTMYRDEIYSLYVVWKILFLLFLNCSAWPCLGPAYLDLQRINLISAEVKISGRRVADHRNLVLRFALLTQHNQQPPVDLFSPLYTRTSIHDPPFRH